MATDIHGPTAGTTGDDFELLQQRQSVEISDLGAEMMSSVLLGTGDEAIMTLKRLGARAYREIPKSAEKVQWNLLKKGTIRKGFFLAHPDVFECQDAPGGKVHVFLREPAAVTQPIVEVPLQIDPGEVVHEEAAAEEPPAPAPPAVALRSESKK